MSIINKMHQDFNSAQQEQPILSNMPAKKRLQKTILQIFILLLLASTLGLSYLIFTEKQLSNAMPVSNRVAPPEHSSKVQLASKPLILVEKKLAPVVEAEVKKIPEAAPLVAEEQVLDNPPIPVKKAKIVNLVATKAAVAPQQASIRTKATAVVAANAGTDTTNQLEIKTAQLTNAQLAQIHLQAADKAQAQGDLQSAGQSRLRALSLLPKLDEVRKSVALYYYAQGDVGKAQGLLHKGTQVSPEYADFNLMLSRIALKAGDLQKAYLYLEKHPPAVAGNLDYYASHAALAQKFKKYEQAERLYTSLLSQRPDNGRWRMSLAIAQDKQGKTAAALENYKKALLQTDLSKKAKGYIKLRLAYLVQNEGIR